MATKARKQQEQGAGQRSEGQEEFARQSGQLLMPNDEPQRRTTRGAQPRGRRATNGRQQSGWRNLNEEQLAQGLGWFSIGLGLAEVVAPGGVAKLIGVRGDHRTLLRIFGLREIASGIGILTQRRPAGAVWSRIAGDALDLACLGVAFTSPSASRGRVAAATVSVLGVTALDVLCARQLSRSPDEVTASGAVRVKKSITINRSPEELYRFWHDFQNLPRFMYHLEFVQTTGEGRSHWVAKAPAGMSVEWDAEITDDRPNELIAWRSLEGADVDNTGAVRFERAPGGRGTIVRVEIEYSPPGGIIGASLAKLFGEEPEGQMQDDLRRFKQVMETGEIVRSEGSLQGMGVVAQRPARPPASEIGQ